jgi:hypothetical protein
MAAPSLHLPAVLLLHLAILPLAAQQQQLDAAAPPPPPEYLQARMQMVVSTAPRTKTTDPLFAEHGSAEQREFERLLQRDIGDALTKRRAGSIDVRNISFQGLRPFLYDVDDDAAPDRNVTAAKADVHVIWFSAGQTASVEDVSGAIMTRFMPNGTKIPSECGIDMEYGINVLSSSTLCTPPEVYEDDRGHCCPPRRWRRECNGTCPAPLAEEYLKQQDSRGCFVGRVCHCVDRPLRRRERAVGSGGGGGGGSTVFALDGTSMVGTVAGGVGVLALVVVAAVGVGQLWLRAKRLRHRSQAGKEAAAEREGEWLLDDDDWTSSSSDDDDGAGPGGGAGAGAGSATQAAAAAAPPPAPARAGPGLEPAAAAGTKP